MKLGDVSFYPIFVIVLFYYWYIYTHTWCALKILRLKIYLSRWIWTINKTLIFFKIISLAFNTLQVFHSSQKVLFWYNSKMRNHISFDVLHVLKSYRLPGWIFGLGNKKMSHRSRRSSEYGKYCISTILFNKNIYFKNALSFDS